MSKANIERLKTSWTKYDCVRFIEIIGDDDLSTYLSEEEAIDPPVLKAYLGVDNLDDELPYYWKEIQKFPSQKRLFALAAGILTHHENIRLFSEVFASKNMAGVFRIGEGGKHLTNLRSALVVSGAAKNSLRRSPEVPYDLSNLFVEGEIGLFFKDLLVERLTRIGYVDLAEQDRLLAICYDLKIEKALSLNREQFKRWIEGKKIQQVRNFSYSLADLAPNGSIPMLKVNQWLRNWDDIDFSEPMRRKPDPHFYILNIDIRLLKHLSDIHRRKANRRRSDEINVQRGLDEKRSKEINRYVEVGYPLSTAGDSSRNLPENQHLKMPGILPTAIVANILGAGEQRGSNSIQTEDLISIKEDDGRHYLLLPPRSFDSEWNPDLKPLEIIDGQHRLMAFDETQEIEGRYEVPVVIYFNLDRAWQAYLFYVINIKPKKINTSLGYDLYPLLRTQSWLENSKEGLAVYRETRAQELVEALWLYEESPWYGRINMLGASEGNNISQAAFIRALADTFLKRSQRKNISGFFADVLPQKNFEEIRWVRAQQAAFLILLWEQIALNASSSTNEWAVALQKERVESMLFDAQDPKNASVKINGAFISKNSMLSRDQGVTGISMFTNDLFFVAANYFDDYDFNSVEWKGDVDERQIETNSIDRAIELFRESNINSLIKDVSREIIKFDWRMPTAEFDDENKRENQKKFKGTGGYGEVWRDLLFIFLSSSNDQLRSYAMKIDDLSKL